jgi:hypothetical protein
MICISLFIGDQLHPHSMNALHTHTYRPPPTPEVYFRRKAIYDAYLKGTVEAQKEQDEACLAMIERRRLATELLPTKGLKAAARMEPELVVPAQRYSPTWTPPIKPMFTPKKASKEVIEGQDD